VGDKVHDADLFLDGLKDRGIRLCISPRKKCKKPARYNKRPFWKRYHIENDFGRLTDGRGIAIRYERCGDIFLNTIILAAIIIFWI
jgi:transposase